MKLGVVEIRARRGRRNVGGSARVCHCVSTAARLRVQLIISGSWGAGDLELMVWIMNVTNLQI